MLDIMKQNKSSSSKKAGVRWGTLFAVVAVGLMLGTQMIPHPILKNQPSWHLVWEGNLAQATEASLYGLTSGFLEIYFVNHTVTPTTAYNHNTSSDFETWADANLEPAGVATHAYANADNFCLQLKYGVAFDIVIRVRYNKTNAWDGAKFIDGNTRVNITCSGFAAMADIVGTNVVSYNNTGGTWIYINVFWQDADGGTGTGFNLLKGSPWANNPIAIKIWAKY